MEEFEIARNITIGQYLAVGSFIHKMDPRIKLLCFTIIVGAITFTTGYIANGILLIAVLGLVALGRIPIGYALNGLKPALPVVLFFALLQVIFYSGGVAGRTDCGVIFQWGIFAASDCSIQLAIVSAARFADLLVLGSLLTFSTTITELTLGTEGLLNPLHRLINFPAHEIALTLTIALRFVPTFAEEMERIAKAQVSRGADFGQQGRLKFIQQTRALLPLVVPLFLSALRRAEEMILAMEARCYVGGKGRTHFSEFKPKLSDYAALVMVFIFSVLVLIYPFAY